MSAEARELLLAAAFRVYARSGIRGSTTRRIAQEAGVNEVTLFRHFGSKEALMQQALAWGAERTLQARLPAEPGDPAAELLAFSLEHHRNLLESRGLIRTCLGEFEEHPDATRLACETPVRIAAELQAYLERLRARGLAHGEWSAVAAASLLMGALFADAIGRDCMPDRLMPDQTAAIQEYVALFLRGIGVAAHATLPAAAAGQASHPTERTHR